MARLPSRQRDQTRARVIDRNTRNMIFLVRCRLINASRPLGMYFLNEAQREHMDLQLKQERRNSIFENRFDLKELDDQECLRRLRFLKRTSCEWFHFWSGGNIIFNFKEVISSEWYRGVLHNCKETQYSMCMERFRERVREVWIGTM